jgi:hypothetical protein
LPDISTTEIQRLLLEACERYYRETRAVDDPHGDRQQLRNGIQAAERVIKGVRLEPAPQDYLQTMFEALDRECDEVVDEVTDPDRWRVAAVRTLVQEAEKIAQSLGLSIRTLEVPQDFTALINDQLPLLQYLQERGSLAPMAAGMDPHGEIAGEAPTYRKEHEQAPPSVSETVTQLLVRFRDAIKAGQYRAAAIFFHGCEQDDAIHVAQDVEEANILIIWLLHASGRELQALLPYQMTREPGDEIAQCEYESIRFGGMPSWVDDS